MSVIDKFLDAMRLNDEDEYEFDNEEYWDDEDEYEEEEEKPKKASRKKEPKPEVKREPKEKEKEKEKEIPKEKNFSNSNPKITPINNKSQRKQVIAENMEVCVVRPTKMDDEIEITNILLSGKTVLINVEGFNVEMAQRIIDFTLGSTYAMKGNLQKISNYIFLATPNGVDISGDIDNILDTLDKDISGFSF